MKEMLKQMWLALGMMFAAWQSLMQMVLNLTKSGEVMSEGVLKGAIHDAEVDSLKLEEEIATFKQQVAVRKAALLANVTP
jgi:hypothetical protein